jgi:hypothetical protein
LEVNVALHGHCKGISIEGLSSIPQVILFPPTIPLYASSIKIPLKNTGKEPVDIQFSTHSGTGFSLRPRNAHLKADERMEFEIAFLPTEMGDFTGTVSVKVDDHSTYDFICEGKCGFVQVDTNYPLGKFDTPNMRPYEMCAVDVYITNDGSIPLQFRCLETNFHGVVDLVFCESIKTHAQAFLDKPAHVSYGSQWDKLKHLLGGHVHGRSPESFQGAALVMKSGATKLSKEAANGDTKLTVIHKQHLCHLTNKRGRNAMAHVFVGCYNQAGGDNPATARHTQTDPVPTDKETATILKPSSTGHFVLTLKAYKQGTHRAMCNFFFTPQVVLAKVPNQIISFTKDIDVVLEMDVKILITNGLYFHNTEVDFGTVQIAPKSFSLGYSHEFQLEVTNRSICDQAIDVGKSSNSVFKVSKSQILVRAGLSESIGIFFTPKKENVVCEGVIEFAHQFGTHTVKVKGVGGSANMVMKCPIIRYPNPQPFPLGEFAVMAEQKPYVLDFGVVNVYENTTQNMIFRNAGKLDGKYSLTCIGDTSFSLDARENAKTTGLARTSKDVCLTINCCPKRKNRDGTVLVSLASLTWESTPSGKTLKHKILLYAKIGRKKLMVKEKSLDFGLTMLRSSTIRHVHLKNKGDTILTWSVDERSTDSEIVSAITFSESSGELAAQEEKKVFISFTPTVLSHLCTHINFQSDGGFCPVLLNGHSATPYCDISNETIDFEVVPAFSSVTEMIELTNAGFTQVFYKIIVSEYLVDDMSDGSCDNANVKVEASGRHESGDSCTVEHVNAEAHESGGIEAGSFKMTPQRGTVYPNQTCTIEATCAPRAPGQKEILKYLIVTEESGATSEVSGSLICEGGGVNLAFVSNVSHSEIKIVQEADAKPADNAVMNNAQVSLSESCRELTCHFGVCLQGRVSTKPIISLKNEGNISCDWFVDMPDDAGGSTYNNGSTNLGSEEDKASNFVLQPDSGTIQSGQVVPLFVSFVGHEPATYRTRFCIVDSQSSENVSSLSLDLSASVGRFNLECDSTNVEFGKCQIGTMHTRLINLVAEGAFPIKYEAKVVVHPEVLAHDGLTEAPVFHCETAEGLIVPNAQKVMVIKFNPQKATRKKRPLGDDADVEDDADMEDDADTTDDADVADDADVDLALLERVQSTMYKAVLKIYWPGTTLEIPLVGTAASSRLEWSVPFVSNGVSDTYSFSDDSTHCAVLPFPTVAVGQTHTMKMCLKNSGELKCKFSCTLDNGYLDLSFDDASPPLNPSSLVKRNAKNCLEISATLDICKECFVLVTYTPTMVQEFEVELWIESAEGRRPVLVRCASDEFSIAVEGDLKFGRVALNTMITRTITINNFSPISCEINVFAAGLDSNLKGTQSQTLLGSTQFHDLTSPDRIPLWAPFQFHLKGNESKDFLVKALIAKEGEYRETLVVEPRLGEKTLEEFRSEIHLVALVSDDHLCVDDNSDVNFGCLGVGTRRRHGKILLNPSDGDVRFHVLIECSNHGCTSWTVEPDCGILKPKETVEIVIAFTPSDLTDFSEKVIIHFHNETAAIVDASINCFGAVGVPRLTILPSSTFHFGPQQLHIPKARLVKVANDGTADLVWTVHFSLEDMGHEGTEQQFGFLPFDSDEEADVILEDPSIFESITSKFEGNGDTDIEVLAVPLDNAFVLPAGTSKSFFIIFKATQEGPHEVTVDFVSNVGTKSTIFFGKGVNFCLLSPIPKLLILPDCELGHRVSTMVPLKNGGSIVCPVEVFSHRPVGSSNATIDDIVENTGTDDFFSACPTLVQVPTMKPTSVAKENFSMGSDNDDGIDFVFSTACTGPSFSFLPLLHVLFSCIVCSHVYTHTICRPM